MNDIRRSVYTDDQQNEEESRIHLSYHLNRLGWKFRDLSQDNDIDGEIEVFDPVDRQTSGKFIKVQIKSISSTSIKDGIISYPCPIKFLHFCDVCDIPVVLILYDVDAKEAYWLWVQYYLYNKLDRENTSWRGNISFVTVKFLINDIVSFTSASFESNLKNIAYTGTNEITQLRKSLTFQRYYTLVAEEDISTPIAKRISAKLLVEASFSSSKDAMRVLIPKINEQLLYSEHPSTTNFHDIHKPCDVIVMFFYNDIKQINHGLPFCRTQWINEELSIKPNTISPDEYIDSIGIKWETMHEMFSDLIPNNSMNKGQYLRLAEFTYDNFYRILSAIQVSFRLYKRNQIDFISLKKNMNTYKSQLDEYYFAFSERGYPPFDCTELDKVLLEFISAIHDLGLYSVNSDRNEQNEAWLINNCIERAIKQIPIYDYEKSKIR
ncbi:DUF4365 domain-containing protein [Cohnella luojiensis]|nr:DUF4365 domain-containing protein [Cohnella luojiensis]